MGLGNHWFFGLERCGTLRARSMEQMPWVFNGFWGLGVITLPGNGCTVSVGQWYGLGVIVCPELWKSTSLM